MWTGDEAATDCGRSRRLTSSSRHAFQHEAFKRFIGEWTNLTAGRPNLTDLVATGTLPGLFAESDDPDRLVPIVTRPERLLVAVAGDPNRANAYTFGGDGPHGW